MVSDLVRAGIIPAGAVIELTHRGTVHKAVITRDDRSHSATVFGTIHRVQGRQRGNARRTVGGNGISTVNR